MTIESRSVDIDKIARDNKRRRQDRELKMLSSRQNKYGSNYRRDSGEPCASAKEIAMDKLLEKILEVTDQYAELRNEERRKYDSIAARIEQEVSANWDIYNEIHDTDDLSFDPRFLGECNTSTKDLNEIGKAHDDLEFKGRKLLEELK